MILLYENNFMQHPENLIRMHWLGCYVIQQVTETGVAWLETLTVEVFEGMVNGSQKNYIETTNSVCNNLGCAKTLVL
jgi:hypothetical protein